MPISRFIITRRDLDNEPITLERDGLLIGRSQSNDLALNHPTVSRTHAGIREEQGDYYLDNVSEANGTQVNGQWMETFPLADGDLIQIGPFTLRPQRQPDGLALEVTLTVTTQSLADNSLITSTGADSQTTILTSLIRQREKPTPKGTQRLGQAMLSTALIGMEGGEAIRAFWENRKREAGKLTEEDSPLKPRGATRLGKSQFHWSPTDDLHWPWQPGLFTRSAVVIGVLALLALLVFARAYAPGALSAAHVRSDLSLTPAIAREPERGACLGCHAISQPMRQKCANCHTTPAFHSGISAKHTAAQLVCADCHREHQGRRESPAQVANFACVRCHHDGVTTHGIALHTPHGGKVGYPVIAGDWKNWREITQTEWEGKELPGAVTRFNTKERFHLIHVAGRRGGRALCSDCHLSGFEGEALQQGVRESCQKCHPLDYQPNEMIEAGTGCVSCHEQHGEQKDRRSAERRMVIGEKPQ